jgi:DNA-directed RNA polymerase subunit RPC12/RpoP
MKPGQILGGGLLFGGLIFGLGCGGWLVFSAMSAQGGLGGGGAILGAVVVFALAIPAIAVGGFLLVRGSREAAEAKQQEAAGVKQRQLLDMVKTRGQVPISDLAFELKASRDDVQGWIHDLVGMGIFSGYVNWDEGILYSIEASQLRDMTRCKHCGGEVQLAGKGVVRCGYCGTEYFLP